MKQLCKLDYKSSSALRVAYLLVLDPQYACERCGRFASSEDALCKPVKTKKIKKKLD
jgi:hypothetical protein